MFDSLKSILLFLLGLAMTVGLLLTPTLIPGGWGYKIGLGWHWTRILLAALSGLGILAGVLWLAGNMIRDAQSWKEPRVIFSASLIAVIANVLYMFLMDWFGLHSGWRALVAVAGVPVIYGNLGRVLGKIPLKTAMVNIFTGALTTMGAGFIIAVILRGWR